MSAVTRTGVSVPIEMTRKPLIRADRSAYSMYFNGTSTSISESATSSFTNTTPTTISFWVKYTGTAINSFASQPMVGTKYFYTHVRLITGDTGLARFTTSGGAWQTGASGIPALNTWTHFTAVYQTYGGSRLAILYINGLMVGSVEGSGNPNTVGDFIGTSGGQYFQGYLSNIRVYGRAITADEVMSLYLGNDIDRTSLVLHYKFNEGSGVAVDSSGLGNTGTISNGTYSTDVPVENTVLIRPPTRDITSRGFSSSVYFDGTTGIIRLGTTNAFTGDVTFGCWMYWNGSNGGFQTIFAKRDSYSLSNLQFSLNIVSTTSDIANDTIASYVRFGTPIPKKQWFYFSWVRNTTDSTEKIYADGQLLSSKTIGTFGNGTSAEITIGGTQNPSIDWFNGYMKEIFISTEALNQTQLYDLSNGTLPAGTPFVYLQANEGNGTTLNDTGGAGHHGTIDGATWSSFVPTSGTRIATPSRIATL